MNKILNFNTEKQKLKIEFAFIEDRIELSRPT